MYSPLFKQILITILLVLPVALHADTFEEGMAAYENEDYEKAMQILQPLAKQGNSQAQITMGIMYDNGLGVPTDPARALDWYIKAAEQGIPVVQHDVGVKYFQGIGTKQDYLKAARWWKLSSDAGLADSQFNLGLIYYRGLGVQKDLKEAMNLFRRAAEQDHAQAQYSLAVMYAFGQGVEKNYPEALNWFQKSAAQGVAQAQYNLGIFYENGYALEKDEKKAAEWYRKAASQGLPEARDKLAQLSPEPEPKPQIEPDFPVQAGPAESLAVVADTGTIKKEDWVMSQPADTYTLQLSSVLNESDALRFIRTHNIESNSAYVRVIIKDIVRFNVLYGNYDSLDNARMGIESLPSELQQLKPWVRNMAKLQDLIAKSQQ